MMKNKKNVKGFTLVELVIVIAVIAILVAVLIPTFATVVANAQKSAAKQSMTASYDAIRAYDLMDGRLDTMANGVLVVKDNTSTKGYYILVENGHLKDDVVVVDYLQKSKVSSNIMTGDTITVSATDATTTIVDTKTNAAVVTFTWNNNGYTDYTSITKVTNAELSDVTTNVCFYSVGEGSVTVS